MDGIPAHLLKGLRPILLSCGPFSSNRQLSAVFVDGRIALWKNLIPEADSQEQRLDTLVDVLASRKNIHDENALVLFLQVLLDRTHEMDSCHAQLKALIRDLQGNGRSTSSSSPSSRPTSPTLNRFQLYNILDKKFDLAELNQLAFFLEISLEDIPGGTREGKIRELIQYAERHSRFEELTQKIVELRSDALD
jgi:hypothetical protein